MLTDFHIFASHGERVFTLRHPQWAEGRNFSSLSEATLHLREHARQSGGWVVIHDEEGHPNRIPLPVSA